MIASRATGTGEASHLRISNDFAIWARNGGCLVSFRYDDDDDDDDAAPGSKMKAFVVEDQSRPGYDPKYNESYDGVSHVGSMDTKLSDVMLAKDDLLEYVWDLGANWAHVMVVESSRDATPEEAEAKVKLVWTNNLSEPEE